MAKKKKTAKKATYSTVKRRGHRERFDPKKVYGSTYAACLSAHIEHHKAEKMAEKVMKDIERFVKKNKTVTSDELFGEITRSLAKQSADAAFMYETHRDIS